MNFVEIALLTVWKPYFLEKDYCRLELTKKIQEIVSISLDPFNVERD